MNIPMEVLIACIIALSILAVLNPVAVEFALAIVCVVVTIAKPGLMFYTLVALMPLPLFLTVDVPFRDVGSLARVLLFGVVLVRQFKGEGNKIKDWLTGSAISRLLLLYTLVCVISVALNPITYYSYRSLFRLFSFVAFYFSGTALVRTESEATLVIKLLMASTLVICLLGFSQLASDDFGSIWHALYDREEIAYTWAGRVPSVFHRENLFAGYLNWMIALGLGSTFIKGDRALRALSVAATVLGVGALLITQSRGGLFGFAGMTLLSLLILPLSRRAKRLWISAYVVVTICAFGFIHFLPDRFSQIDPETLSRFVIFGIAIDLIKKSPFIGIGFGSFRAYTLGFLTDLLDTHNLYLKLLAETGAVGMVAYLWMKLRVLRTAITARRRSPVVHAVAFAVLAGTTSELIHGTVDVFLDVIQVSCAAWLMIALLVSLTAANQPRLKRTEPNREHACVLRDSIDQER